MLKIARLSLVVVAIALATLLVAGCGGGGSESKSTGAAEEPKTTAPGEQAGTIGIDVGQMPPSFTLSDLDGNKVSLSDFEGQVVVLDLWATWCPPCRQEIPFLMKLYNEYKDEGLAVIGIGLDRGGADALAPFVQANNVTYTILVGDESVSRAYKVSSIPMTLTIGRDGRVAARDVGFAPSMADSFRARVVELLSRSATEA